MYLIVSSHESTRGITPYSESSPPEEINDDVLPGCPMSTSAVNQSLIQSEVQKNIIARSVSQQAQKMSQRPIVSTSQLSSRHANMASSSSSISMPHYQTGGRIGMNANIADIHLSFTNRTNLDEQRTDVLRILHMLKTYSLSECHDKVHWLATVVLHHQRDLELFRAGSMAVEQCLDDQLRKMDRRLLVSGNGKKREKQLDQQRKDLTSENDELKKREAELKQTLTQYEAKCQDMKLEEGKLKAEKQQIVKDLEAEKRSAVTKIGELERERDDYRRRLKEMTNQETEMQRRVLKLEHNLEEAVAKNKCVPDRPAEGTNTVEDQIKMLKQRLKRSKTEAKQQCVELNERNHQVSELEAQLKASTEKASKHRHKEMKLRERSTKKTVLLEKALSDKQKAEDELNMLKDNANLLKSNFDQFDTGVRKIAQKKLQLDRAIASIEVQPKCTKCLDIVNCEPEPRLLRAKITQLQLELDEMKKKKAPKVTIRMVDPAIAQPMQQQRIDEEDWSKKRRTLEDTTEAFDEPLDCNKRPGFEPTAQIGDSSGPSSSTDSDGDGGTKNTLQRLLSDLACLSTPTSNCSASHILRKNLFATSSSNCSGAVKRIPTVVAQHFPHSVSPKLSIGCSRPLRYGNIVH
uniref:Uncharacterized protein n=1 Tax=Globodera rostochiensis TaxID=31243 RepID=A0A914HDS1_GLORO